MKDKNKIEILINNLDNSKIIKCPNCKKLFNRKDTASEKHKEFQYWCIKCLLKL
jgi:uncharacterized C2H2 Zn-finger protein